METMKKILLIDPDRVTASLTQKFLKNYGYETDWCSNAKDALSKLNDPTLSMVLTEVDMPGLTGFDVLKLMKKCFIEKPVAFFTSKDDSTTKLDARMSGALEVISKNRDFINLPAKLELLFSRSQETA